MRKTSYKELIIKDFLVSGESFSLVLNETHGYLETRPQPKISDLPSYYDSAEYISHTDSKRGLMSFLYQLVKGYSLRSKLRTIKKLNRGIGTLLDIGAGTGAFLEVAQKKGWQIHGVEPNDVARKVAAKKNVRLLESLDDFQGQKFDVITLWHVLEHVPDLHGTVKKIESLLAKGGTLIVAVPNFNAKDAIHYKDFWAAYDVPRHLWHFSQPSIRSIFSSELDLMKTKAMPFDAFYVSLLSEKYKTGNSFSLRAIWVGLQSNLQAMKSKEYSSLAYCFKKSN